MSRRETARVRQLGQLHSIADGRLRGPVGWEKLPLFWFLLFLSYRCTRKCSYCYAFNQVGEDNVDEMDEWTFSRLLEWIPEVWKANGTKVNAVGFLGGEPLLRTDRIRRVMDAVYDNTDGMQGFVYTNGDLVDALNWDDLEDIQWYSVNITEITIDELARRMKIIAERSNAIGQTVVATLDDGNLERAREITRFGVENGYRLRYYRNLYRGLDAEYKTRLLAKYHEICDLLEEYVTGGYDVHTTFLIDTLIPGWEDESSPYPCGKRVATVFPDGSIGPCIRNHVMKSGTIFDQDPMSRMQCDSFHYDLEKEGLPQECRACEVRTTCQGGCPNDKLVLTGSAAGKSVMCEIHKEIIPRLRNLDKLKMDRQLEVGVLPASARCMKTSMRPSNETSNRDSS
jgi:radical SAM protein with 4Fe4S-binding SPASM domain